MNLRRLTFSKLLFFVLILSGCAAVATHQLDERFGKPAVIERTLPAPESAVQAAKIPEYFADIKPVADRRCVVCHGCYDAPCQLKMSSFASIDRGASKEKVYDGYRLLAGNMTRMSVDAGSTEEWRAEGFFPVLNERQQTPVANREGSLLYQMLQLKQLHPLPEVDILPDSFDFSLNRKQECAKIEEFDRIREEKPLWGMPYGLPGLPSDEQQLLMSWAETGAKAAFPGIEPDRYPLKIEQWETFFNGTSNRERLVSRYIYEHLFLANLYFDIRDSDVGESRQFYKLVRSRTAPGRAIELIATRRPYDDPGDAFYYRLQRVRSTVLAKQNMPYRLDEARMQRWQQLFYEPDYPVESLPGYEPELASNPFITFGQLPARSRYQFMLDEAGFTIMGFIKGPVCRGQVALNVINDQFWVLFVNPDLIKGDIVAKLAREREHLRLPAEKESTALMPLASWLTYAREEKRYLSAKKEFFLGQFDKGVRMQFDYLWDGDGDNRNAALTIFRHFDSATVRKGLIGKTPKTAWVIDYPLLERIHYLLVAGFDVFGNLGHQLLTRLYMDFLRMEGEYNFLLYLPKATAAKEIEFWYRDKEDNVEAFLQALYSRDYETTGIDYSTDDPKVEFFQRLREQLGPEVIADDIINRRTGSQKPAQYQRTLRDLADVAGLALEYLPEQSLLRLHLANGQYRLVSLLKNRAHTNVAQLFNEEDRLIPQEQTLTVVETVVGAYPNAFFELDESQLQAFVVAVRELNSDADYHRLKSLYGVRRTDPGFWSFSDAVHAQYFREARIDSGFLDYNRLENR